MDKKAVQLDFYTVVFILILLAFLFMVVFLLSDGFNKFSSASWPPLQSAETQAVQVQCNTACTESNKRTFCCKEFSISGKGITCENNRLNIECNLSCVNFYCGN